MFLPMVYFCCHWTVGVFSNNSVVLMSIVVELRHWYVFGTFLALMLFMCGWIGARVVLDAWDWSRWTFHLPFWKLHCVGVSVVSFSFFPTELFIFWHSNCLGLRVVVCSWRFVFPTHAKFYVFLSFIGLFHSSVWFSNCWRFGCTLVVEWVCCGFSFAIRWVSENPQQTQSNTTNVHPNRQQFENQTLEWNKPIKLRNT
jgi:hypothetical protein